MRQRLMFGGFIGFLIFLIALFYFVPSNPDMESVLSGKKNGGGRDSLVLFSLFAFALATVTLANGYKKGKRGRDCQREQLYIKIDELISEKKKTEGLNHLLKQDREQLFLRANELEGREKLLHQSILVLKKDIDNLLGQREKLEEELKKTRAGTVAKKKKKRSKNAKT